MTPSMFQKRSQGQKKQFNELASDGGLVRVAKRTLKDKGIVPPDGPMLVGIIIEGMERIQSLPQEKVMAIRNLGFLAMNKKCQDDSKKGSGAGAKRAGWVKHFYQDMKVDPNLNL